MGAPHPTGGLGDVDWNDFPDGFGGDNVTDADLTWLQERSIVRISGSTPTTGTPRTGESTAASNVVANVAEGRTFYSTALKTMLFSIGASFKRVFSYTPGNLVIDDAPATPAFTLRQDTASSGVTLTPSGVTIPALKTAGVGYSPSSAVDSEITGAWVSLDPDSDPHEDCPNGTIWISS